MDFATALGQLNFLAVLTAALSTFVIGGIWYSVLEKSWMAANHFTAEDLKKRNMPVVFGLTFLFSLLMSFNLALFIGKESIAYGTMAGFMTGFGWVALSVAIISLFENRSIRYVLINGGYMIVSFTIMGAILGAWK